MPQPDAKDLKRLQQELKKAQHELKVAELNERRENEIRRLDWEKEKFKLQLEHDKERWVFESKKQEQALPKTDLRTQETLEHYILVISELNKKIGELTAQVEIYKPFFDKHMAEHKSEMA